MKWSTKQDASNDSEQSKFQGMFIIKILLENAANAQIGVSVEFLSRTCVGFSGFFVKIIEN